MGGARRTLAAALCSLAVAVPATAEGAPLKVREVYPGSTAAPQAEYVQLQMTAEGSAAISGNQIRFYDQTGDEVSAFTLPNDVAAGASQRTVLVATAEATAVGASSPDFVLPSGNRLGASGGGVCLVSGGGSDCVGWGTAPMFELRFPDPQGSIAAAGGIPDGKALRRTLSRGCPTWLDPPDDSGNSGSDFTAVDPAPRNNATPPPEEPCPPETSIGTFPPSPTNSTSAGFAYAGLPAEQGITFECALDWADSGSPTEGEFSSCPAGGLTLPGPLTEGLHRFAVRATGAGGTDPSPKMVSWLVDTTPPETVVDSGPPEPSNGFAATFAYRSSEEQSGFRCQLDDGPVQVCSAEGKTYFNLADGAHRFRVWAVDNATNQDPSPAERSFTVQNVLRDATPPDTMVLTGPRSQSGQSGARFTYASSEPGSTFECRLGGGAFTPCLADGISYSGLKNGPYRFEVRARDRAGNIDSVPGAYAWTVAAPPPDTRFTKVPGGRLRAQGRKLVAVSFSFSATDRKSTFRCRLDLQGRFRPCRSPKRLKVKPGRHVFEVYAVDRLGNVEPTPARRIFRVQRGGGKGGLFG